MISDISTASVDMKYLSKSLGDIDIDNIDTMDTCDSLDDDLLNKNTSRVVQQKPVYTNNITTGSLSTLDTFPSKIIAPSPKENIVYRTPLTVQEQVERVIKGNYLQDYLNYPVQRVLPFNKDNVYSKIPVDIETNYRKNLDGTFEMINQNHLRRQKQVLGFLMKQFGSSLFSGKSIMNVSLPVTIFEPQSHLERHAKSLLYAPYFLETAGSSTDSLLQFKLAITQAITSLHLGLNPQKPFNPILGETFQGVIKDTPVYIEQISHHPPVLSMQVVGKTYTLEGNMEFSASISMNSVKSKKIGYFKTIYKNTGNVVLIQYPSTLMGGTALGRRLFQFSDKLKALDYKNKLYAEIDFECDSNHHIRKHLKMHKVPRDYFYGNIYKVNDRFADIAERSMKISNEIDIAFKEKDHAISRMDKIKGSWLEYLQFGEEVFWSMGHPWPPKLQYFDNPLPSDSNFRLDILYLKAGDETKAQDYKQRYEVAQRGDKKLRDARRANGRRRQ